MSLRSLIIHTGYVFQEVINKKQKNQFLPFYMYLKRYRIGHMSQTKTNFIKFNVSPQFKSLAEQKAKENGMTLSELGRMLFGAFITSMSKPTVEISPKFLRLAEEARQEYESGETVTLSTSEELIQYLHSTKE